MCLSRSLLPRLDAAAALAARRLCGARTSCPHALIEMPISSHPLYIHPLPCTLLAVPPYPVLPFITLANMSSARSFVCKHFQLLGAPCYTAE